MHIHQLSVIHDEQQDRLLLRLNTQDAKEFLFWLTRRLSLRLLPAIQQSVQRIESIQPGVAASAPAAKQMLTEFKRQEFLEKADFSTPYSAQAQQWPLGPTPILVTDVQLALPAGGGLRLDLQDKTDKTQVRSCQLQLEPVLVHGLIHLIEQCLTKAQWRTNQEESSVPKPLSPEVEPPHYTH